MSIGAKLFSLFSFLILILVVSGYLLHASFSENFRLNGEQSAIVQALTQISNTNQMYSRMRWSYLTFLNQSNDHTKEQAQNNLQKLRLSIENLEIPSHETDTLQNRLSSLHKAIENILTQRSDPQSLERLTHQAMTDLSAVDIMITDLGNELRVALLKISQQNLENTYLLKKIPVLFIVGGLLTLIFVLAVLTFNIFMPVSRITKAMQAASHDMQNARMYILPAEQNNEIGNVTKALNHLLKEVSSGIEKISQTESRLRETGQYLQTILDNMLDGIIIADTDGTIVSFNPSAEKILGYKNEEVAGKNIDLILLPEEKNKEIIDYIHNQDTCETKHIPYEIKVVHKNNMPLPVEVLIGTAVYKDKLMNILTVRDITIRKQMENLLNQAQRMETIGRMSGGIAHDFNNMLIVISGNLELIDRRLKNDPELKEMIGDALKSVDRGKELTQRMLAFSRKQLLKPEVLCINDQLPGIIELIRRAVREDVGIETQLCPDIWNIYLDPAQFESALLNLAINARDAISGSGGKITIKTKNASFNVGSKKPVFDMKAGDYVKISLSDNGAGIPRKIIDRVFEPFFTTKEVGKGTGLGLSMVYGFTRQSGGYIKITSKLGQGTTIDLYFPKNNQSKKKADRPEGELIFEAMKGNNESILVAEDKPDVLKYLTVTLRELGYKVTPAKDGASALNQLKRRKNLNLLITDVVMPGELNGGELAAKVKYKFPQAKVLFISGYTSDALVEQGTLKNEINLLTKPFTSTDLGRSVKMTLGEKRLNQA